MRRSSVVSGTNRVHQELCTGAALACSLAATGTTTATSWLSNELPYTQICAPTGEGTERSIRARCRTSMGRLPAASSTYGHADSQTGLQPAQQHPARARSQPAAWFTAGARKARRPTCSTAEFIL